MKRLYSLKQNQYIRSLATLSIGTIISQVIVIGISPIITRIYHPNDMGAFTIILSIISMFVPILNLRYEMLIVSAKDDREANKVAITSMLVGIFMTIIILFGLIVISTYSKTSFKGIGMLVYTVIPVLLIQNFINVFNNYNNRNKQYKLLSSISVVRSVSQVFFQVLFGVFRIGTLGLILSQIISLLFGFKRQMKLTPSFKNMLKDFKKSDLIQTLKKYKQQPFFSAPAIFINALSYSLITLLINHLYDLTEVGYYSLSFRILGLPMSLISTNVAQIFFSHASEEKRLSGNFSTTFKKTSMLLTVVSVPIFLILMLTSEGVFELVFGEGWGRAGLFVALLSPMYAVKFIASSLSLSVIVAGKQKKEFFLQILFLMHTIISYLFVKYMNLEIEFFLGVISFLYSLTYIYWFFLMQKLSKESNMKGDEK